MEKTHKHILSIIGLVLVAIITTIAYFIPEVEASAASSEVEVRVVVHPNSVNANFTTPLDNLATTNHIMPVALVYSHANQVRYKLLHTDPSGHTTPYDLPVFIPSGTLPASGTHNFSINLSNYGNGYGKFVLKSIATGANNSISEDAISFWRVPAIISHAGETEQQDPIINFEYSADVCSAEIQAFYKNSGKPLFQPAITYTVPTPRPSNNISKITLPFAKHHAQPGDYDIKVRSLSCNAPHGEIMPPASLVVSGYKKDGNLQVPNTGGISFAGLNFARSDYLLVGLVGFFAISSLSLFALARKGKARR